MLIRIKTVILKAKKDIEFDWNKMVYIWYNFMKAKRYLWYQIMIHETAKFYKLNIDNNIFY